MKWLDEITEDILDSGEIDRQGALTLLEINEQPDIFSLLDSANRIRHRFMGNRINLCAVVNAKSGLCPEDCTFCSQSVHYNTDIRKFPLLGENDIVKSAKNAKKMQASRFGIVISGKGIKDKNELVQICNTIKGIKKEVNITKCASLGTLDKETAKILKTAGLQSYHHNLETSKSYFPNICTTHTYEERVNTIRIAKETGFEVCCGGLFGLGESNQDRVELAFTLKQLDIDMVPLNFLNPVAKTPLDSAKPLSSFDVLKIIAMFRFVLPKKDIKVCGGREENLKTLQPFMYIAGASGTMVGDYLTTKGRDWKIDLQEIEDLGLNCVSTGSTGSKMD